MVLNDLLNYKRVLLLQGPVGPFFTRLAGFMRAHGSRVFKINFNGGDSLFFPAWLSRASVHVFSGRPGTWREYISRFLQAKNIDAIVLFGDCRFYHRVAIKAAQRLGIQVFVFEEGYVRPDYITLERHGVNGNSRLPRTRSFYASLQPTVVPRPKSVGTRIFLPMMVFATLYGIVGALQTWRFPFYRHHNNYFSFGHGLKWLLSAVRKQRFRIRDRGVEDRLSGELSGRYFLVPLQVQRDAQVLFHSDYKSIRHFIRDVITSFAADAPRNCYLVFKHHPMDRGFNYYGKLISEQSRTHGVADRVMYVHDLHLPTLLKHARGTLVINSTVGLSSLVHNTPVKTLGRAIYDMPGLSHQGTLAEFWREPGVIDRKLYARFREYVVRQTQVNGSFYFWLGFRLEREYGHINRPPIYIMDHAQSKVTPSVNRPFRANAQQIIAEGEIEDAKSAVTH